MDKISSRHDDKLSPTGAFCLSPGRWNMPWRFDKLGIDPARIETMHRAYESACASLGLSPVPDRINEILVIKIIELSKTENDPDRLCEKALDYYRNSGT
jgi:hypothetical protein